MVYIKRIDLRGFKTFGRKTTIHLDRGLTIVTGPNGSGKSNILDSVKFALGELSPKELRGETIGDLVHKGAMAASTRSAYVAVQFDNHDRRIPVDAEAVSISREFRRGGEGIYRMNGRKISRKQLTDILSSADIQVSSYNIVPQHAITRLAEVTTEERRKIIEDMIGIGVYDVKKESAETELQKSDVNLQVASAKIEEVRLRVESLERERNNYLKFLQIRKELNECQAKSISHKIKNATTKAEDLNKRILENQQGIQALKTKRDELTQVRTRRETEKRGYEDSVAAQGTGRLLETQRKIGDLNAAIARLHAHRDAIQNNILTLQQQKSDLERDTADLNEKILTSKSELQRREIEHENLSKSHTAKQAEVENSLKILTELRERIGERNKEAEELENKINLLSHRMVGFSSQIKASSTKAEILTGHIHTLETRKKDYRATIEQVTKHLNALRTTKIEEANQAAKTVQKIESYTRTKTERVIEIENAMGVTKRANLALAEVETRSSMAQRFASDYKALQLIEEMAKAGTVSGVFGRLADLIEARPAYEKAVEAASTGWLKAIVVKDFETAISCIEVLKKTKVGRVKLIPLKELAAQSQRRQSLLEENITPVSQYLTYEPRFQPAVEYVFGDTVLAPSQKAAFLVSLRGVRAVTLSGDVYEASGAMETGYFRQPIDMAKLLTEGKTFEHMKRTLSSLETLTAKAKEEIARIDQELQDTVRAKTQHLSLVHLTEKEITNATENLERAEKASHEIDTRINQLTRETGTEQTVLEACKSIIQTLEKQLAILTQERGTSQVQAQSGATLTTENVHSKLTAEANDILRQKIETEGRIKTLHSTIDAIEPTHLHMRNQIAANEVQYKTLNEQLNQIAVDLPQYESQLTVAAQERDHISQELTAVKSKREEYDESLRELEKEITGILDKLDPLNTKLADSMASSKQMQMQIDFHLNELKELGSQEPTEVSDEEVHRVEETIPVLKKDLASIGGVNELAAAQYDEVKDNYKQLASRIYALENEKLSIVRFMNELDRQKLEAFMKAFTHVSNSFNETFATVTSGVGRLFLENPENPFEAGADIKLQFPGKTEMSIGSASGGEKSVGTVCFILALQAIHPMPFYLMDEIDAHLDVVNSQKLAELLKAKSKGSQFIVNSLKDVTIARADAVFGVFIQEGVSQVVNLPMQEVRVAGRNN